MLKSLIDKDKAKIYETCIPDYLKHDIDEYLKYKDDKDCTIIDCLLDEIYGSINSALYSEEITEEQANYLRDKYYYGLDWLKGKKSDF
ncbi:MAG TPA: hypothetical protein IAD45_01550 [Candidatus Faecimonas intestinavium]|nr:hypothetical protein [Candidatus Faecimonas intestinavium]